MRVRWLREPTPDAVADAVRAAAPELAGLPISIPDLRGRREPLFQSSSAALGEEYVAKFAWSEPAARRVRHQVLVLEALAREPTAVPGLPEVVARGDDPLIMVTRRVPGTSLWCDWADAVLAEPAAPVVLVHADFHGDNQVWDSGELLTAVMGHYERLSGRSLSTDRVMAWHVRQALGDALWRSEAGIPLQDRRSPSAWVRDLADRFRWLGIDV